MKKGIFQLKSDWLGVLQAIVKSIHSPLDTELLSIYFIQSLWSYTLDTAVWLPCPKQNFKVIRKPQKADME